MPMLLILCSCTKKEKRKKKQIKEFTASFTFPLLVCCYLFYDLVCIFVSAIGFFFLSSVRSIFFLFFFLSVSFVFLVFPLRCSLCGFFTFAFRKIRIMYYTSTCKVIIDNELFCFLNYR